VRDNDDPGMACLRAMVRWRIAAPTCEDHASTRTDHDRHSAFAAETRN
jgi:hypothetical protein